MSQTLDTTPLLVRRLKTPSAPPRKRLRRARARALPQPGSRLRTLCLAGVAVFLLAAAAPRVLTPLHNLYTAEQDIRLLRSELVEAQARNAAVRSDIDHLRTRYGVEQQARRIGLVAEGEVLLQLSRSSEDEKIATRLARAEVGDADAETISIGERVRRAVDLCLTPLRVSRTNP